MKYYSLSICERLHNFYYVLNTHMNAIVDIQLDHENVDEVLIIVMRKHQEMEKCIRWFTGPSTPPPRQK